MQWIAAAIVFCFLMWRWPKKIIISICAVCICIAAFFSFIFIKDKIVNMRLENKIKNINIIADYSPPSEKSIVVKDNKFFAVIDGELREAKLDTITMTFFVNGKYYSTFKGIGRCSKKYPLSTVITNNSNNTITYIKFEFYGYEDGRSSNAVDYSWYDYNSDYIVKPGEIMPQCWALPKLKAGFDPKKINWKVRVKEIVFSE